MSSVLFGKLMIGAALIALSKLGDYYGPGVPGLVGKLLTMFLTSALALTGFGIFFGVIPCFS